MKKLIVLILICLSQFNAFAQQNEEMEFIKNFYEVYMFNFDKVEPNRGFNEISKTLVDNYLTKELNIRINKAIKNGVDYNIILNAQDVNAEFINTFNISLDNATGCYIVNYGKDGQKHQVKLKLTKIQNKLYISNFDDVNLNKIK